MQNQKHFFLLTSLVLTGIIILIGCGITRQSRIEIAEEEIKKNPELRETDNFCREIPLPENTKFVEKARVFRVVGIIYSYSSDKSPEFLYDFFTDTFTKKGWEFVEPDSIQQTVDFKNDKFKVRVTLTGFTGDISFSIYCGKLDERKN